MKTQLSLYLKRQTINRPSTSNSAKHHNEAKSLYFSPILRKENLQKQVKTESSQIMKYQQNQYSRSKERDFILRRRKQSETTDSGSYQSALGQTSINSSYSKENNNLEEICYGKDGEIYEDSVFEVQVDQSYSELGDWSKMNLQQAFKLFEGKCKDNKLDMQTSQLTVFMDRVKSKMVNGCLDLAEQSLGECSAAVIGQLLKDNKNKIIRVQLGQNRFGDEGIKIICEAIYSNEIIHLDLSNNGIGPSGIGRIVEMLQSNSSIISLDISSYQGNIRNRMSYRSCIELANYLSNNQIIQFLKLGNCCIQSIGLYHLSKGLSSNKSLIYLDLQKNYLGPECGRLMSSTLIESNIIDLNLSYNSITDTSVIKIGESLKPGIKMCFLEKLDLSNNGLTSHGVNYFFDQISKNSYLKTLILDSNSLYEGLPDIVGFMQENSNLTSLSLKCCGIYPEVFEFIATGLARNNSIKSLFLRKNFLKDEGASKLASILKEDPDLISNKCLKILDISRCGIEDEGAKNMALILKSHPSLRQVDMRFNVIGDTAAKMLLDSVKANKQLDLTVEKNLVSWDILQEINRHVKLNNQIKKGNEWPSLNKKLNDLKSKKEKLEDLEQKEKETICNRVEVEYLFEQVQRKYDREAEVLEQENNQQSEQLYNLKQQSYGITHNSKSEENQYKKIIEENEDLIAAEKIRITRLSDDTQKLKQNLKEKMGDRDRELNMHLHELQNSKKILEKQIVITEDAANKLNEKVQMIASLKLIISQKKKQLLENNEKLQVKK